MVLCVPRDSFPKSGVHRPPGIALSAVVTGDDMATKMAYREQLLHPNWQKRRLEMLNQYSFQCGNCGDKESTLHVHHRRYVKGRMVWEYQDMELEVLCEGCHKQHHADQELMQNMLFEAAIGGEPVAQAVGLLGGFFAGNVCIDPDLEDAAIKVDGHSHDLGILASIACGADWPSLVAAVEALRPRSFTPAQENAYLRWKGQD